MPCIRSGRRWFVTCVGTSPGLVPRLMHIDNYI
nr:MAG TPA: C4-dicarboxylate transport sensor protein [Caudoviricetes sp.]